MHLYNQYCDGMFAVASRYISDSMEAEDMVQESFIKAFKKIEQFKGEVSFGAWLKRIVINRCIDSIKSKRERMTNLEETHLQVIDKQDSDDEWWVEDSISVEEVKNAIDELPDRYKYVIKLYLMEGYDHQEISQILGISEVASRTQLLRGKRKLQEQFLIEINGTRS